MVVGIEEVEMGKGASFEREISKQLSLWWSGGTRDDIFWRTSQSGGRATQRAKFGKSTFAGNGDIAAVDPIGQALLQIFTIELKRGRSHGSPGELLDALPPTNFKTIRPFEAALNQAVAGHVAAGSHHWMLICKRDRTEVMVYFPFRAYLKLREVDYSGYDARFRLQVRNGTKKSKPISFVAFKLRTFLQFTPRQIVERLGSN